MEIIKTTTVNNENYKTSMFIDIVAAIFIAIFMILNFAFNKGNVFFRDIINYSAFFLLLSTILAAFNYKKQIILFLIAAAAIFLGAVYGGLFGVTGMVCIWLLLAMPNFKISRFTGFISTLAVAFILALYSVIWGKLIGATYFEWANWLVILFSLYLVMRLLFTPTAQPLLPQIQNADQISKQSQYFAEMSHEIRTPLNAILGFADTMQEEVFGPLNTKYKEYIGYIQQSGNHLLDLVGDILDMSKIEAGKYNLNFAENDVVEICKTAVNLLQASATRQKLVLNFYGYGKIIANCDARSIRQIVLNLISNSIKFTPQGGIINISTYGNENKVWIEISDNGKGMDADELKHITDAYVSGENTPENARGTGLGLSLVKKLVEFHNGKIKISSKLMVGTDVLIELPLKNNIN